MILQHSIENTGGFDEGEQKLKNTRENILLLNYLYLFESMFFNNSIISRFMFCIKSLKNF